MDQRKVLEKIYREPWPNRYISSLSLFLGRHQQDETIREICLESFNEFFTRQLSHFKHRDPAEGISLSGAVAFHFQEILREAAANLHLPIHKILSAPSDELIRFHRQIHGK